jgi:hypothetical protein
MSDIEDIQKEIDEHIKSLESQDAAHFARKEIFDFENETYNHLFPLFVYLGSILMVLFVGYVAGSYNTVHSIQHYATTVNATQLADTISKWGGY